MQNKTQPMYASVIISDGALVNFFMNEITTNKGTIVLDDNNKIVTIELYTPDDVMEFLTKCELINNAIEIEI